jgi:hypothetical protein
MRTFEADHENDQEVEAEGQTRRRPNPEGSAQ